MEEITYQEAIDLMAYGGRDDVLIAVPQPMSELTLPEVRKLANAGAVFSIPANEEKQDIKPFATEEKEIPPEKSSAAKKAKKELNIGKIRALKDAGWDADEIAAELGCSIGAILTELCKDGGK
ncbi:MAG: hypothetical protein PHS82_06345 [Lachnospiraceae bacterium]|nr:hypothetical protein [Lachnospiraceae bacterium]